MVSISNLVAQGLPNDCRNYIQVCGNYDISLDVAGAGIQEIGPNVCDSHENNSLWLHINIEEAGTLGFTLRPASRSIEEDFDFWVFGPDVDCNNLGSSIRCSTTNPLAAGQRNNFTGLSESSNDYYEGPGPNGDSFLHWLDVEAGETYFLVIDRPIGYSSFNLTWTGTAVLENPLLDYVVNEIDDIHICDNSDEGTVSYDFSIWNQELVSPLDNNIEITYHASESDASYGDSPLSYPDEVHSGVYYARIKHVNSKCFEIVPIRLILDNVLDIYNINQIQDVYVCDSYSDGYVTYDFSILNDEIVGNSPSLELTYHTSMFSANAGLYPLSYPDEIEEGSYYVRILDNSTGCYGIVQFNVVIDQLADYYTFNDLDPIYICNVNNDNHVSYDLSIWNTELVDDDSGNLEFSYHISEDDAIDGNNPLSYPDEIHSGTYYVRISDTITTNCFKVVSITIVLENPLLDYTFYDLSDIYICDNNADGVESYDFSVWNDVMISPTDGVAFSYHTSASDAEMDINALDYPDEIHEGTFYVRITSIDTGCYLVKPIAVIFDHLLLHYTVNDLDEIFICDSDGDGYEMYDFSILNNAIVDESNDLEFTYYISESDAMQGDNALSFPDEIQQGQYYVRITDSDTQCYEVRPITISMENFELTALEVVNNNQINALVNGQVNEGFEFSLDGGEWQDSHQFTNVSNGLHKVQLRYLGCLSNELFTYVLNVYNVITPNGDGLNDKWVFEGLELYEGSEITIYDRYGKEIYNQSGNHPFVWDGTYNGRELPSGTYWYMISLPDGRRQQGHVTIKNR